MVTSVFSLLCRVVFVYKLGMEYLGVSGLFSNVLGVLSFTELGIGSAIIFSLYKPIAEDDREKVKSLLGLYKKAYRMIAIIVATIGICIIPFLHYLVNSEIPMYEIRIYYLVFLFNTVSSYFVTYKTSYVSALQKEYIITNITSISTVITSIFQIIVLLMGGNYMLYLLVITVVELIQKIVTVLYINRKFPIVTEKNIQPIDERTKSQIWRNVKALIVHKIGEVSVHQTDNIIISSFVSTAAVGMMSNYTTLSGMISMFTDRLFGSFTASFGNMIAKESVEKQRAVFDVYDLLGFWVHSFVLISFLTLSQPFLELVFGKKVLVDNLTVFLYFFSEYMVGMTYISYSFNAAAGKFSEDKWFAFIQAVTNLVVSIVAINVMGLPGIYVGTIISRLVILISKPYVVNKYVLQQKVSSYYLRLFRRTAFALLIFALLFIVKMVVLKQVTILGFFVMCVVTLCVPNLIYLLIYRNSTAFKGIIEGIKRR